MTTAYTAFPEFMAVDDFVSQLSTGSTHFYTGIADFLLGTRRAPHADVVPRKNSGQQPGRLATFSPVVVDPLWTVSPSIVARIFGIDDAELAQRISLGEFHSISIGGHRRMPAWQFGSHDPRETMPGLQLILDTAHGRLDWDDLAAFMSTPQTELVMDHPRSPAQWLHLGHDVASVVYIMETTAERDHTAALLGAIQPPGTSRLSREEAIETIHSALESNGVDLDIGWEGINSLLRAAPTPKQNDFDGKLYQELVLAFLIELFDSFHLLYLGAGLKGGYQSALDLLESRRMEATGFGRIMRVPSWQIDFSASDALLPGVAELQQAEETFGISGMTAFMAQNFTTLTAVAPVTPREWLNADGDVLAVVDILQSLPLDPSTSWESPL